MKNYTYLNIRGAGAFQSALIAAIEKMQPKAGAGQWIGMINGLTQKGVKGSEIKESEVLSSFLEGKDADEKVSREELVDWLYENTRTIKEIPLEKPLFKAYGHAAKVPGASYKEVLYVLNTAADNFTDRLEEIRFEIEELSFDRARLAKDPQAAVALANEYTEMMANKSKIALHSNNHFTSPSVKDPETGESIKNLMGHVRYSINNGIFLIDEIQSDWAQRGRKRGWGGDNPEAPFVMNTEAWAGVLLRRAMQIAASMPEIRQVNWIKGSMRNGSWDVRESRDGLDDFYLKMLPKIADKALGKSGQKTKFMTMRFGDSAPEVTVPGFEMTPAARERLSQAQPLYSRDMYGMRPRVFSWQNTQRNELVMQKMREMLGSMASIRLAAKIVDEATGQEVAGRQTGRLIEVSMTSRDPAAALLHEGWHYAQEHMLSESDSNYMLRVFAPGTALNARVRTALRDLGADPAAIAQCDDAREACAHAFALWCDEQFDPESCSDAIGQAVRRISNALRHGRGVTEIFKEVRGAFVDLHNFVQRIVGEIPEEGRSVAAIFERLASGEMARDLEDDGQELDYEPQVLRPRAKGA